MKLRAGQRERLARHLVEAVRLWARMENGYDVATQTMRRLNPVPHAVIVGELHQGGGEEPGEFVIEIRDELASLMPS